MIHRFFESGTRALLRHVVVHAVVEKDGALLLVRRAAHLMEGGKWGLPGGFLDRDETLSEGVLRELREETGWEGAVAGLLRVNSRPDRPHEDRQNVAFDFIITPHRKLGEPDAESTAVEWIPIEQLPPMDSLAFDHGETVTLYLGARDRSGAGRSIEEDRGRVCTRGENPMSDGRAIETEATELLRTLIRNKCVNDGTVGSGQETRNVAALEDYFAGSGVSCEKD